MSEILPEGTKIQIEAIKPLPAEVTLRPPERRTTDDQALWVAIRNRTKAISFNRYREVIDKVLCKEAEEWLERDDEKRLKEKLKTEVQKHGLSGACPSIHGVHAYNVLKLATEIFLMLEAGVVRFEGDKIKLIGLDSKWKYEEDGTEIAPSTEEDKKKKSKVTAFEEEESSRYGYDVTLHEIETALKNYFGDAKGLPYLENILRAIVGSEEKWEERLPYCEEILRHRFTCPPMIELIWSYWHEEGMLVQTLNAISLRFQNRRISERDPLAQLEIDPLRPLNNLLWGYIQDEQHRLTVVRRAYEYDHHYGITLYGRAVPRLQSADSRSKFIEAFHNLLYRTAVFYREDADTTVVSDGFPLLNALKELHLILAEGAHNQFGDLPWTARVEMLIQKWILSRPEMREFLRGRAMVPYKEPWMGQVDTMKKLQGWTDVGIMHFHDLAVFGEQILLSVRYGDWSNVVDQEQAKNWARYWKPEIQGYIHAYRAVTGVDLTSEPVDSTPPSVHLKRAEDERKRAVLA